MQFSYVTNPKKERKMERCADNLVFKADKKNMGRDQGNLTSRFYVDGVR